MDLKSPTIDIELDVFAVHGVGGMFGIVMLAVLGHADWTAQLGGIAVVGIYTIVVTFIIVKVVAAITPIRVPEEEEITVDGMAEAVVPVPSVEEEDLESPRGNAKDGTAATCDK